LYQALVKNQPIFASINAYISGDIDAGLLIIQGQIANGTTTAQAEAALETELQMLYKNITPNELQKTKNQAEAATTFNEATALNVAIQLAYHELLGDANGINTELKHYQNVEITHLKKLAKRIFAPHNCSTLIYEPVA
jgi:hypothetical protein